jgi:hypothetical protein
MSRIHAGWRVAFVKDAKAVRNLPVLKLKGKAMGAPLNDLSVFIGPNKSAVTLVPFTGPPYPTTICFFYLRPKPF